jgi:hypothetical protein
MTTQQFRARVRLRDKPDAGTLHRKDESKTNSTTTENETDPRTMQKKQPEQEACLLVSILWMWRCASRGYQIERQRDVLEKGQGSEESANRSISGDQKSATNGGNATDSASGVTDPGDTSVAPNQQGSITLNWNENGRAMNRRVALTAGRVTIDVNLATGGHDVDSILYNRRKQSANLLSGKGIKDGKSKLAA